MLQQMCEKARHKDTYCIISILWNTQKDQSTETESRLAVS